MDSGETQEFAGMWHEILSTARLSRATAARRPHVQCWIRAYAGLRWHEVKMLIHGGDYGEPCATVMLPDEDRTETQRGGVSRADFLRALA